MAVKSVLSKKASKFDLGDKVKTPSGLIGEIIGLAEYYWGWEYRVMVPGKAKTMYRRENRLTLVKRGSKEQRAYWGRHRGKYG